MKLLKLTQYKVLKKYQEILRFFQLSDLIIFRKKFKKILSVSIIVSLMIMPLFKAETPIKAATISQGPNSVTAASDCINDTSTGSNAWENPNNAATSNDAKTSATIGSSSDTNNLKCVGFGFNLPLGAEIAGVQASIERSAPLGVVADASVFLVKGGVIQTATNMGDTSTAWSATDQIVTRGSSTNLWNNIITVQDVNASNFGFTLAATRNGVGLTFTADVDHMQMTIYYYSNSLAEQTGYIWENEDGLNSGTAQAAGNTALTDVRAGEKLTLRTQIKNSTGADTLTEDIGLFYDHNDGNFVKVDLANSKNDSGTGCAISSWQCTAIDTTGLTGEDSSLAFAPGGRPYIVYRDITNTGLRLAEFVGSGGSGCASAAWTCTTIANTNDVGYEPSLAFDNAGNPHVSYRNLTNTSLDYAQYIGGTTGTGCTSTAWICRTVDGGTTDVGYESSLKLDKSNRPYISYRSLTDTALLVATKVFAGGCTDGGWGCTIVDNTGDVGYNSSLSISPGDNPYVSYRDATNSGIRVAQKVFSGSAGGTGCSVVSWTCTLVDSANDVGYDTSIAFSPNGTPFISYRDLTNTGLRVAQFVGVSGTGCAVTTWTCTAVETTNDVGYESSIAFGPGGMPIVSYRDFTNTGLRVAQYVGTGGTGCAVSTWNCYGIETTNDVGYSSSISVNPSGNTIISYYDTTTDDLRVAQLVRQGAITFSPSANQGAITSTHADMTSVTDSVNKADADCIGGGTFNNGVVASGPNASINLLANNCTELAFTIDTSQATPGTTYRFVLGTSNNIESGRPMWRGPTTVATGAYPTITIEAETSLIAGKSAELQGGACDIAAWTCTAIDTTNTVGFHTSLAFSPNGTPYISHFDSTNSDLRLAQFVGSGGTGCATTAWTCTSIDTTNNVGGFTSLAFSPNGTPYISYYDSTNFDLRLAQYVGSGGTGCATTAWTCTAIDTANDVGRYTSIAFSPTGTPYISYYDTTNTDLRLAQYVGSGGTGCATTAWTCTAIDTANLVGYDSSIAFSPTGTPYISYRDTTNTDLRLAQYVGSGGTGCATTAWTCTAIDTANNIGEYTSIAFSPTGTPYISYYDFTNSGLRLAQYVGSGGTGCATTAWTCTAIDTTNTVGEYTSLAFSPNGTPYIGYSDATNSGLRLAQYVGSGGTGCATTAWTCTAIDTTNDVGGFTSLAFSPTGTPYISYYDTTNSGLRLAQLSISTEKLTTNTSYTRNSARNGIWSLGAYRLADGRSPRTAAIGVACGGASNQTGYCGLHNDDGNADSITTRTNGRPVYNFKYLLPANTELPTLSWIGKTDVAPSTAGIVGDLKLQVYRFGTTNAWEDVVTDSSSSSCTTRCQLIGIPSGTIGEYYEANGSKYNMHVRVWQYESPSLSILLSTELIQLQFLTGQVRHGARFENGIKRPFAL